jgi:HD-GYP domain-containing protein (c-di-GMP phosphodiesterase class II)
MGHRKPQHGSHKAVQLLHSVREGLAAGSDRALEATIERLDALEAALTRVMTEHSGMAEELLRVYEQLGIVFEVTRALPSVHHEDEVLRLFVESLRPAYSACQVEVVRQNADGALIVTDNGTVEAPWVRAALATCRDQHRVVVAERPETDSPEPRSQRSTRFADLRRIMCGPIYAGDSFVCALLLGHPAEVDPDSAVHPFDASDMLLLESLNTFCGDMIGNFRLLGELRQLSVDTVGALISAVEQKDEYTSGHSTRVGHFAKLLGMEIGLDDDALQMLEWSALLHDCGKIGIRDEVLKKAGRLTAEEFEHIKEHPKRSHDVVRQIPQLADALHGVLHHHEHWDGSGYPAGLAGENIPLQARIIQVADVFDALTSTRSYRQAFDRETALSIIRDEAGTTVDPKLSAAFDRLIRRMACEDPAELDRIMGMRRLKRPARTSKTDNAAKRDPQRSAGGG